MEAAAGWLVTSAGWPGWVVTGSGMPVTTPSELVSVVYNVSMLEYGILVSVLTPTSWALLTAAAARMTKAAMYFMVVDARSTGRVRSRECLRVGKDESSGSDCERDDNSVEQQCWRRYGVYEATM